MNSVAIIGGGAAGCFCAVEIKRRCPSARVVVYEAGKHPMAKLAITGGGRCNITNSFEGVSRMEEAYPRGGQLLKRAFSSFSPRKTCDWWENEGVSLVVQDDCCIFPRSQDAMQVVRTLEHLMRRLGVQLVCEARADKIEKCPEGEFLISFGPTRPAERFERVVLAAGGTSEQRLRKLLPEGVAVSATVPSLFTFRLQEKDITALMGTVVEDAALRIPGTSFRSSGTLLLTDWGFSGPCTLKLSSYAARFLSDASYCSPLLVSWIDMTEEQVRSYLSSMAVANAKKNVANTHPEALTERLWRYILQRAGLRPDIRWAELGKSGMQKLASRLVADEYHISARCAFKEEFVTCGGVDLSAVNIKTLESRAVPGLFFAGEVLDIDAITGGFNLQAAWSTAFVAAQSVTI